MSSVEAKKATSESLAAKAKLMEGVDFIENEEDVEAVESAVVKIQSTFRGKKIRSKLSPKPKPDEPEASTTPTADGKPEQQQPASGHEKQSAEASHKQRKEQEEQLHKEVAKMQVNDNTTTITTQASSAESSDAQKAAAASNANLNEDEAATKIQAGFKGYKTRKELEGKLASGQQQSPGSD